MATRPPPETLDEALERVNAKIKLQERFNDKRARVRDIISEWINYIRLYFKIKQNPYFTMFGLDKVNEIDDAVIKGIYVKNRQYVLEADFKKKEQEQRDAFYSDLERYKKYDDRFKEQPDKKFNDRFNEYNPSNGVSSIRLFASKVVSDDWLNAINNLLSEYKDSPPPPNQQLEVKDVQTIITNILAYPIETKNADTTTNHMLNEIDLEFSKKLDKMDLSEPESELGGRRADAEKAMAERRERNEVILTPATHPHLYAPGQGPYPGFDYRTFIEPAGGKIRSAKRRPHRKSSATKRHPRRKSSAINHRRRRTSRK